MSWQRICEAIQIATIQGTEERARMQVSISHHCERTIRKGSDQWRVSPSQRRKLKKLEFFRHLNPCVKKIPWLVMLLCCGFQESCRTRNHVASASQGKNDQSIEHWTNFVMLEEYKHLYHLCLFNVLTVLPIDGAFVQQSSSYPPPVPKRGRTCRCQAVTTVREPFSPHFPCWWTFVWSGCREGEGGRWNVDNDAPKCWPLSEKWCPANTSPEGAVSGTLGGRRWPLKSSLEAGGIGRKQRSQERCRGIVVRNSWVAWRLAGKGSEQWRVSPLQCWKLRKLELDRHLRPCVGQSLSCWCSCVTGFQESYCYQKSCFLCLFRARMSRALSIERFLPCRKNIL